MLELFLQKRFQRIDGKDPLHARVGKFAVKGIICFDEFNGFLLGFCPVGIRVSGNQNEGLTCGVINGLLNQAVHLFLCVGSLFHFLALVKGVLVTA